MAKMFIDGALVDASGELRLPGDAQQPRVLRRDQHIAITCDDHSRYREAG